MQSCVQGDVNITFLLLFNGVVALTGGQQPGGARSVAEVAGELISLGVREVGIVGDGTAGYGEVAGDPRVRLFPLDRQAEAIAHFRQAPGTTVMILDKECATEKGRRRRRRGGAPERYVFIDEEVCEGCGDCLRQSEGCAALYSVDTELGDKRQVQQASCMQDELCLDGECPSFLTVQARGRTRLRRRRPPALDGIPEPRRRELAEGETLTLFTVGRGGTGVVTVSHLIAWAALLDGLRVYLSNNTGLAQKGGPVEAPIQLARSRQPAFHRLLPGGADVYIGFDLLRAAEASNLRYADPGRTVAVVSTTRLPTAGLNRNPEQRFPDPEGLAETIDACTRKDDNCYLDTSWLAEGLFGDILFANVILLGAAFQSGQLPLRADSLEAVIRLNGKAVEDNLQAFRWGRLAVADPDRVRAAVGAPRPDAASVVARSRERLGADPEALAGHDRALGSLDLSAEGERAVSYRIAHLVEYQDSAWAGRYVGAVERVREAERAAGANGEERLTLAAARSLHRLMTFKDEYEVARLIAAGESSRRIEDLFDGPVRISHHLHPPTLRPFGVGKIRLGPWIRPLMGLLYRFRRIRGTALDPFRGTSCRRLERELISWYEGVLEELLQALRRGVPLEAILAVAEAPDGIRGFEHVKEESARRVRDQVRSELEELRKPVRG